VNDNNDFSAVTAPLKVSNFPFWLQQKADAAKAIEAKASADTAEKVKALKEAEAQVCFDQSPQLYRVYFTLLVAYRTLGLPQNTGKACSIAIGES
jgi:hypothetical protein